MGQLIVNGEIEDIPGDRVTAGELKRRRGAPPTDWVMAKMPDGMHNLADTELVPANAERVSIVPAHQYGLPCA